MACVVGGTLPGALVIALMFGLCFYQGRWRRERRFVVGLALLGLSLDSIWMYLGILDFGSGALHLGNLALAPPWIILLWIAVGLSLLRLSAFSYETRPRCGHCWCGWAFVILDGRAVWRSGHTLHRNADGDSPGMGGSVRYGF